jgi:drug/metabolite transporter (DMT)-like permease
MPRWGVTAAVVSSILGGTNIVATRAIADVFDPEMLGVLRFGLAGLLLLPLAIRRHGPRVPRSEFGRLLLLGLLLFTLQPLLYNFSLVSTTAARAALAMSTMPLLTMLLSAAVGHERLTRRRTLGVLLAMAGVALALLAGLGEAPEGAWIGDLVMLACAGVMAVFNVLCPPVVGRVGVLPFTCFAMLWGILPLELAAGLTGDFAALPLAPLAAWAAVAYLGIVGGVCSFLLWSYALKTAPPTLCAVTVSLNPVAAVFIGALWLGEQAGLFQILGLAAVCLGIWVAAGAAPARRARVR